MQPQELCNNKNDISINFVKTKFKFNQQKYYTCASPG